MKIEELHFSARVYNCLKRKGIDTVEQLKIMSDADLLQIRYFGIGCLKEVREKLGQCVDNLKVMKQIPVSAELEKAIRVLLEEFEKTRNNSYIHNPVAWALYHAWKRVGEDNPLGGNENGND